jgi:hypothetical protein
MNVTDARRFVKIGQAAVLVLGLSAAVTWAFEVPGLGKVLPAAPEVKPSTTDEPAPVKPPAAKLDRESAVNVAETFEGLAHVKKPAPATDVAVVQPPAPPPAGPAWTYLGPIQEPNRRLALLSINSIQKVLAEGRKYGESKLVSVASDEIVVEDSAGLHHIARSERSETAPRVAWVKTMPTNQAPQALAAATPGQANGISPEVAQRLRDRGIDPAQADRFRQQQRDRRNRGQPGGGGNGNGNGAFAPGGAGQGAFQGGVQMMTAPGTSATQFITADEKGRMQAVDVTINEQGQVKTRPAANH